MRVKKRKNERASEGTDDAVLRESGCRVSRIDDSDGEGVRARRGRVCARGARASVLLRVMRGGRDTRDIFGERREGIFSL